MDVQTAILTRRSHKQLSGAPVPDSVLASLVELAIWAPNHKLTEPWRFCIVAAPRLPALADAVEAGLRSSGMPEHAAAGQSNKIRGILAGAGGLIALIRKTNEADPLRDREDYAACACALQNIQLGAWGQGYAGYWTTSAALIGPGVAAFWGLQSGEELTGAIVLGIAAGPAAAVRRKPAAEITTWL